MANGTLFNVPFCTILNQDKLDSPINFALRNREIDAYLSFKIESEITSNLWS